MDRCTLPTVQGWAAKGKAEGQVLEAWHRLPRPRLPRSQTAPSSLTTANKSATCPGSQGHLPEAWAVAGLFVLLKCLFSRL